MMGELDDFRKDKDDFFRRDPQSPLTREQRSAFNVLRYFPEDPALDLKVDLEAFPDRKRVNIMTNTGDAQSYIRLGRFRFTIGGGTASLTVYANEHGYFFPFADSQAGEETYGAGGHL